MLIYNGKKMLYKKLSRILSDISTAPNIWWLISKVFLNKRKTPCMPPLFLKRLIVESPERLRFYIAHFSNQYLILIKNSILPINLFLLNGKRLHLKMFTITDIKKKSNKYEHNFWQQ